MSPKDAKGVKQKTGADLRAQAEARLAAQAGPAAEAQRREASFLKNLSGARDDYQWIMSNEAWTQLGYADYTTWYVARVYPLLKALGARPSLEIANDVLDRVPADEAALPAPQRRTQDEIAELAGVSKKTVARRSQDLSGGTLSPGSDLEGVADPTAAFDAKYSTNSQPAASDERVDPVSSAETPSRPAEAPTGQPSRSDTSEGDPPVATNDQSGHEPTDPAGGIPPAPPAEPGPTPGVSSGPGAPEEGDRARQPSSGASPAPDPVALAERWLKTATAVDDIDPDQLGPAADDDLMKRIDEACAAIADWNSLIHQWRDEAKRS